MKKNLLILTLVCLVATFLARDCSQRKEIGLLSQVIGEKDSELLRYTNRFNREVARRQSAEIDLRTLKEHYPNLVNEIKQGFDIKLRNVKTVTKIETHTVIKGIVDTVYVEMKGEGPQFVTWAFNRRDRWHSLSGQMDANRNFSYELSVNDSITAVAHQKSGGMFRKTQLYIDAVSHNPYTSITGARSIHVGTQRKKPFGLGAFAGVSPTGFAVGVGVTYSPIRF